MEGRCTADLNSLLRLQKPLPVLISSKGVDSSFSLYKQALTSHLSQTPVVWRRSGKVFPYRITFPLVFGPFSDEICWSSTISYPEIVQSAFLHVFFVDCASVDEYRTSVRHNLTEWFAKVSSKADIQWLVVIDSTRAKEKKNRSAVIDKLKTDFSKHQSRLIEVSESVEHGSFSLLVEAVQSCIFAHLELFVSEWENYLDTNRDFHKNDQWNVVNYCRSVTDYARLYTSLGAYEHALSIYDDLDRFLFQAFGEASIREVLPSWLVTLRNETVPVCPTLSFSNRTVSLDIEKDCNLLCIRHFLVSRQILLCLQLYTVKFRASGAAPSLRLDFASLILKYAEHAIETVLEQSSFTKRNIDEYKMYCWNILFIGEALQICGLLSEPNSLDSAVSSIASLYLKRFQSVLSLAGLFKDKNMSVNIQQWLTETKLSDEVLLIDILQNESLYSSQLMKVHDTTSSYLTQNGRLRVASFIGFQLSEYLVGMNRSDVALPYRLRLFRRLVQDGFCSQFIVDMAKDVVSHLDEKDVLLFFEFYQLVAWHDSDLQSRKEYGEKLAKLLCKQAGAKLRPSKRLNSLLSVAIRDFSSRVQLPDDKFTLSLHISNEIPFELTDVHIDVIFRELDEGTMSRRKKPVFQLNYSERDSACRILSPHRGHFFDPCLVPSPSSNIFSVQYSCSIMSAGDSLLELQCMQSLNRGVYILDQINVYAFNEAIQFDIDKLEINTPPAVFIQTTPNKLWIAEDTDLLAGVAQELQVIVEAGSILPVSSLSVTGADSVIVEFMDENQQWANSSTCSLPDLKIGEQFRLTIPICVQMDISMTESPAVRKVKVVFSWLDRVWNIEVPFTALLILSSKTSLLENRILFELEVSRALADQWTVILETAELTAAPLCDGTPPLVSKLLNTEIDDLIPNSVTTLIWTLPADGDSPINHQLLLIYRVRPSKGSSSVTSLDNDRTYKYEAAFDLRVPKVGYELCTQMLSQQPGAQLCRAGSACDLVVSLRSLLHVVELLYIVLDADARLWQLNERAKVLQVKESGLGQLAFSVVPCAAGFLPYPSVSVYSCIHVGPRASDGSYTEGVDILPGAPLLSFQRTAGKQIRVLAASHPKDQTDNSKSEGFKKKFGRLFD